MNNSHKVATLQQMNTDFALRHRNRIFNEFSFSYRSCVECNPEDSFLELPAIVTKMNAKIDAKNLFLKHGASSAKEIRYDDYLLQMETMSPDSAVIEPFDFTSMRPSRAMAAEIFKKIPPTGDIDTGSIILDQEKKLRFLSRISSLDFEKDTRLSYGELFRD